MAVASLILGIVGLVLSFFPFIGWIGMVLAVVGIILGAIGRKDESKRGMATAGLVLSIIAVGWAIIATFACAACVSASM